MDDKKALLDSLSIDRSQKQAPTAPASKRGRMGAFLLLLFGLALGGAVAFWAFDFTANPTQNPAQSSSPNASEADSPSSASPVSAPSPQQPKAAKGDEILNASGYITARRIATISAEITGRITDILVEEGMAVKEGQLVARLDDALAQIDLSLAKAQMIAARATLDATTANLAEAKRVLVRVSQLSEAMFSSEASFTQAKAAVEALTADLARAEADLEIARLQAQRAEERVRDHLVLAPFAGVVIDKNAQPGEIIAPGSAGGGFTRTGICTIVDMDSLEIEVDVNESFIGLVSPGQPVKARLDAYPDWVIKARVIAIIPTANRDRATVRVRIGLGEKDPRILPDMGVNVAFLNTDPALER
ncbi:MULTISPECIES: efflux RND transporter periplasmic adaptor subunit [unclassified Iodidimonas]|jgi:RND family efflux transporter MFP subunit|uniref:efflux RND transporter periplasmic adaptor subunit n=1 Tax=unclassified Iodidimonas TaxID=2626145 RepID=UPI0024826C9A|nr:MULTISPECIES: efflux RND transporter periplasmic adaptor subunit [unclassified Iodidimonas]